MAEQSARDVVNQAMSMGEPSPIDVSGNTSTSVVSGEEVVGGDEVRSVPSIIKPSQSITTNGVKSTAGEPSTLSTERSSEEPSSIVDKLYNVVDNLVNGDSASFQGSDDHLSFGQGSDVAPDSIDVNTEGIHRRDRSNSAVKKPASFKPVSVTKNFLAKTGAAASSVVKNTADKALSIAQISSPSPQPLRPRLVAKSGRDSRTLSSGTITTAGPDASKVWNRNQPVPAPPPKQFTDEELKQHYGIHLATRLPADEAGKESKWADMDDDEDDWAPETVEWMDGTKSTLVATDTQQQAHIAIQKAEQAVAEMQDQAKKAESGTQSQSSQPLAPAPGKILLRPGIHKTPSQTVKPGLVLKSVPEHAGPAEKPTAHGSSKSPWAALPPVDKASPVSFNPPQEQRTAPTMMRQDARKSSSFEQSNMPGPSPAKEFAADDFDRGLRDSDRSQRELFNSQSGRYEPVKSQRRGSRTDSTLRTPAVLQRPGVSNGPPSGYFDEHRLSQDARSWAPRRGSPASAFSGEHRRGSSDAGSRSQHVGSPVNSTATPVQPQQPSQRVSDVQTYSAARGASQEQQNPSAEDVVAKQKQLMKEKIEAARRRKQEEEAREEAERKERIRLKLESLAPLPPKPVKAESPTLTASKTTSNESRDPTQSVVRNEQAEARAKSSAEQNAIDGSSKRGVEHETIDTARIDVSSGDNNSHHHRDGETSAGESMQNQPRGFLPQPNTGISASISSWKPSDLVPSSSSTSTSQRNFHHDQTSSVPYQANEEIQPLPGLGQIPSDRIVPSRQPPPSAADPASHWSSANRSSYPAHPSSVWGPLSTDRLLGNGAFDSSSDYHRLSKLQASNSQSFPSQRPTPSPQPIQSPNMPQQNKNTSSPSRGDRRGPAPQSGAVSTPAAWQAFAANPRPHDLKYAAEQTARMKSQVAVETARQASVDSGEQVSTVSAWNAFAANPRAHDEKYAAEQSALIKAKIDAEKARQAGVPIEEQQTKIDNGESEYARRMKAEDENMKAWNIRLAAAFEEQDNRKAAEEQQKRETQKAAETAKPTSTPAPTQSANQQRSRFFGPGVQKVMPVSEPFTNGRLTPSPPPPEEISHPVHDGSVEQPVVRLGPPKITVKMPPAPVKIAFADAQVAITQASSGKPGSQTNVQSPTWQERINKLVQTTHRKTTVMPAPAAPVASTADAIDQSVGSVTTVSIPQTTKSIEIALKTPFETKLAADFLLEDREMGSLPVVKVAKSGTTLAYTKPSNRKLVYGEVKQEIRPQFSSTAPNWVPGISEHGIVGLKVWLPDMKKAAIVRIHNRPGSNARRGDYNHAAGAGNARTPHTVPSSSGINKTSVVETSRSGWAKPRGGHRGAYRGAASKTANPKGAYW